MGGGSSEVVGRRGYVRLIQVIPSIAEESSGPSYSVRRLSEALEGAGNAVTLAAIEGKTVARAHDFVRTFPPGPGPARLGSSPAMKRWLREAAGSGAVSLLHGHSLWMMPNVYPGWVAKESGIPLVVSPRGTLSRYAMRSGSIVKRIFWPLLQKPALEPVACFHATAQAEYEDIRRMGFGQPVIILPNGIDLPPPGPSRDSARRRVLFLGRIHPIKGLDMLLPAWRAVQHRYPDWDLHIVGAGSGDHSDSLRRMCSELHLERVEFRGELHGNDKWRAYRDSELFVLPSRSENFGMSVAEALASGVPAIVSRAAPWAGLRDNDAGWWVEVQIDALVAALEQAMSREPGELAAMGERGRQWMQRDFSWAKIGERMTEAYRWVVAGGPAPDCVRQA
jgi:glycosyltransferase involved in cell wall biosynthesis